MPIYSACFVLSFAFALSSPVAGGLRNALRILHSSSSQRSKARARPCKFERYVIHLAAQLTRDDAVCGDCFAKAAAFGIYKGLLMGG